MIGWASLAAILVFLLLALTGFLTGALKKDAVENVGETNDPVNVETSPAMNDGTEQQATSADGQVPVANTSLNDRLREMTPERRSAALIAGVVAGNRGLTPAPASGPAAKWSETTCARGYYSYIPRDLNKEVGFSVEVQPTAVEVLYADMGHIFARRQTMPDRKQTITFSDNGSVVELTCYGEHGAAIAFLPSDGHPLQDYDLVRTRGNIHAEYERRGWAVAD